MKDPSPLQVPPPLSSGPVDPFLHASSPVSSPPTSCASPGAQSSLEDSPLFSVKRMQQCWSPPREAVLFSPEQLALRRPELAAWQELAGQMDGDRFGERGGASWEVPGGGPGGAAFQPQVKGQWTQVGHAKPGVGANGLPPCLTWRQKEQSSEGFQKGDHLLVLGSL
jgi:hypothetical protein